MVQLYAGAAETTVNSDSEGSQFSPRVERLMSGGFVILWGDESEGAVAQLYDANGAKLGAETTIRPGGAVESVSALATGGYLATFNSGGAIFAQRYDASGAKSGDEIPVSPSDHKNYGSSVAVLASGGFVVAWNKDIGSSGMDPDWDIYARRFEADGTPAGDPFRVNLDTWAYQSYASVTALQSGGFLISWDNFGGFTDRGEAQIYDSGGNAVGGNFGLGLVGTKTTALSEGGFVTIWTSPIDEGGTTRSVRAQIFDDSGHRIGSVIMVNTSEAGEQRGEDVSALPWGGFVVTWTDINPQGPDPDRAGVMAQVFDAGGGKIGPQFLVNAGVTGHQYNSVVTGLASGDFVVAWTDLQSVGDIVTDLDVKARVFQLLPDDGDDTITGDDGPNILGGGDGNDIINGLGGADRLDGEGGNDQIHGFGGADQLTGGSGDDLLDGGDGNDILRLYDGGDDTVLAGAGSDTIFFIGSLTSADVVNGGADVDTLVLQGPYGALTLTANVTEIENISLLGGGNTNFGDPGTSLYDYVLTTHDANFAAGVQARINGAALLAGEDFTFNGSAETNASFVVYGGKGADSLTGGLGNDIFFYAEERFASGDVVNGGSGYDGMFLRGNYTIDFNAPGYTGLFTSIENLTLTSATDERYARGGGTEFDYSLILSNILVGAGAVLTVSGTILTASETMILDGSQESDGVLRLFGGKAGDTLKGGGQADLIHGNLGADILAGGGGADSFRYQALAESNAGSMDQILDFTPGTDKIELDRIDAKTNVAGDQAFSWIGSNAFSGVAGQLRAFQSSGAWFVEGDVNGDSVADLVIALNLQGPTPLGAGDFLL